MDQRNVQLAKNLIHHSVKLQKGEKVQITSNGFDAVELVNALVREAYAVGAIPFVRIGNPATTRELMLGMTEEIINLRTEIDFHQANAMDAFISISASSNTAEMSDVPIEILRMNGMIYGKKIGQEIVLTRKWVGLNYPTPNLAQAANKSHDAFKDFYYKVCTLDYKKMDKAMDAMKELMERTDKVRITGVDTDLTFSIKGLKAVKCAGEYNIPDGEIFTSPIKDSVNGYITYNTPSNYQGFTYENVRFEFENGKIVKATANNTEKINKVLDADEGARYIGEFALGVNPYIETPMNDTLFDEKIKGSFHFTPGMSYPGDGCNGNVSAVHWDLVFIQTPEFGGGEIYFDDVLVRKDGRFVLPELDSLNPENLV